MGVEKISVRTCPYKCALPSSLSPLRIHTDRGYQSRRQRLGSQLVGLNIGYLPPICRGTPLDQETTPMSSSILPWRVESTVCRYSLFAFSWLYVQPMLILSSRQHRLRVSSFSSANERGHASFHKRRDIVWHPGVRISFSNWNCQHGPTHNKNGQHRVRSQQLGIRVVQEYYVQGLLQHASVSYNV